MCSSDLLAAKEFEKAMQKTDEKLRICFVEPSALHFWEEPPISGEAGSGAIFFTGCPLRCVFCQNHDISQEGSGRDVPVGRVAQMMLELEAQGATNINLVTPLHFAPQVRQAVLLSREAGMTLPVDRRAHV